jgi:RimJ/RimL family protein N-acetyltransferase
MNPPEVIESVRLRLRKPVMEDASLIFERFAKDSDVTRYLTWRPHENIGSTKNFLKRCLSVWEDGSAFPYVVVLKEDDQLIGIFEIRIEGHRADIGFALAKRNWGNGYMTEAAQAIVDWAFKQDGIFRVWAFCDRENRSSARVLEKVGMRREGVLRRWAIHPSLSEEPRDCYVFAKVR